MNIQPFLTGRAPRIQVAVEPVPRVSRPCGHRVSARKLSTHIAHLCVEPELQRRPRITKQVIRHADSGREVESKIRQTTDVVPMTQR